MDITWRTYSYLAENQTDRKSARIKIYKYVPSMQSG